MEIEQRTLIFVKPGHLVVGNDIFDYLNSKLNGGFGYTIDGYILPTWEQMDEFYSHTRGMPFHDATIERYVKEGLLVRRYYGENLIERVRHFAGDKDPLKAEPWTIRGMFGTDSFKMALRERRFLENVVHSSENCETADREERILL